ncbi:Major facilitator superfamily domain, general substrate transporter [Pseudocohnilembus persalinus]|uniref:Major facilitator superfamily domain, general substrate transporter n=1 Tax=Pseudocohnilembus persalinus TaxID=266149 RepID=A0A0V0QRB8_PSEPJ|nr:Major facilitator superfamily domain, general substrate transporter [Pseudocohnilembus persalinus]|eukprot:KRX04862.1 Major facilitator superfamily domain, general substrate transporter [Pseudocohnilembus persalinus]
MVYKIKIPHKYLSVLGGLLIFMVLSAIQVFGFLMVYLASNLQNDGKNYTIGDLNAFLIPGAFANAISVGLSAKLQTYISEKLYCVIVMTLLCLSWFALSLSSGFVYYAIFLGFMIPFFEGMLYLLPIYNLQKHFSQQQGLIGGILFLGFGIGNFVWNPLLFSLINPENIESIEDPQTGENYFPKEVTDNLQSAFTIFALILFMTGIIGSLLIKTKKQEDSEQNFDIQQVNDEINKARLSSLDPNYDQKQQKNQALTFKELIQIFKKLPQIKLTIIYACAISFGFMMTYDYKSYGLKHINDDKFYVYVANVIAIANGGSRVFWGFLYDKIGFRILAISNLIIQLVLIILLPIVVTNKALFLTVIFFIFWTFSGWAIITPLTCSSMYGIIQGKQIFGIMYMSQVLPALIAFTFVKFIGWEILFFLYAIIVVIGLIFSLFSTYQVFPNSDAIQLKDEDQDKKNTKRSLTKKLNNQSFIIENQQQQNNQDGNLQNIKVIQNIEIEMKRKQSIIEDFDSI